MKYLLIVLLLFGSFTKTMAQSMANSTPEQRAQMQTGKMKEKLALNDDQLKKVSALNLLYAQKMDPIIHSDDSRLSKYRKAKPLLDEKDEKLKAIFTKDQYKQYEELKKEMMDKARDSQR